MANLHLKQAPDFTACNSRRTGSIDEHGIRLSQPIAAGAAEPPPAPLHGLLRDATLAAHERLHGHDGFAAVQAATIDIAAYRGLLLRLYGFHRPFETAMGGPRERGAWLEEDLRALGVGEATIDRAPRCARLPDLRGAGRKLGALYVVEGSALGGRGLGRGLDPLLGQGVSAGRRFFLGRGAETGGAWRAYLARLASVPATPDVRAEIVEAATETFTVFEAWMAGWKALADG